MQEVESPDPRDEARESVQWGSEDCTNWMDWEHWTWDCGVPDCGGCTGCEGQDSRSD